MSIKKKYVLVMPDTGKSPLKIKDVKKVIHVPPPKVIDKEIFQETNTVHPLEAETAEFSAVNRTQKYKPAPIVKSGVKFLKWINIFAFICFCIFMLTEESKSFSDFVGITAFVGVVFYYQIGYLNKIGHNKSSFSFKWLKSLVDFELIVMLGFVGICVLIFTIN